LCEEKDREVGGVTSKAGGRTGTSMVYARFVVSDYIGLSVSRVGVTERMKGLHCEGEVKFRDTEG